MRDDLEQWATRNGVSTNALNELVGILGQPPRPTISAEINSEAATQAAVRILAPKIGVTLWRNNVGVAVDKAGNQVRYGIANDSQKLNRHVKSSDLVGVTPIRIGHRHLGRRVGVLTAFECKKGNWEWSNTARERAQRKFLDLVLMAGGIADFVRSPDSIMETLEQYRGV